MRRICHITTVHQAEDVRIFHKECSSLAEAGFEVHLVCTASQDYTKNGVQIHALNNADTGRLSRMTKRVNEALAMAKNIQADVYHLHDPELLRIAGRLKKTGVKVVFDAHEDTVKQLLSKPYFNSVTGKLVSASFKVLERRLFKNVDYVIGATASITNKFKSLGFDTITISNYPKLDEFSVGEDLSKTQRLGVCYAGGISMIRGAEQFFQLPKLFPDVSFEFAGPISDEKSKALLKEALMLSNVIYHGVLNRADVVRMYYRCAVALLLFHPVPNHVEAVPNKLFEYMAAQLPILASDFDSWKPLFQDNQVGMQVDPLNMEAIADALTLLLAEASVGLRDAMGKRGLQLIENVYNWESEQQKLVQFYNAVVNEI